MKSMFETGESQSPGSDFGIFYLPGMTSEQGHLFPTGDEDFVLSCASAIVDKIRSTGGVKSRALIQHVKQNPPDVLQYLITNGGLILVIRLQGEISVYSQSERDRWPKPLVASVYQDLHLFDDSEVAWYSSLDGNPTITTAGVVMKGKKPVVDKPEKPLTPKAKETLRKKFWGSREPGVAEPAEEIVNKLLQ